MFCVLGVFGTIKTSSLRRAEHLKDERQTCGRKLGRLPIRKKPETSPAESALRIAPVCKNHRPHELEDLVTRTKPRRG